MIRIRIHIVNTIQATHQIGRDRLVSLYFPICCYSFHSANANTPQLGAESVTTASTPDDIKTPESTSLTGFHFHIDDNPVGTSGPVGPHLFRLSGGSEKNGSPDVEPMPDHTPIYSPLYASSKPEAGRRDDPIPDQTNPKPKSDASQPWGIDVESWSPQDVVRWMQYLGFDDEVVEKFFINDISGSILMELQPEDLKELDIPSFGKRHRLLGCIRQLRNSITSLPTSETQASSGVTAREPTPTQQTLAAEASSSCSGSPVMEEEKPESKPKKERRHRHRHHRRRRHEVVPEKSVSIVAIEQLLPKLHTCSKGENCAKWQKQQNKIERLAKYLPIESFGGSIILTGDPGNAAHTQTLLRTPKSEITPSVVASSDALGPNQRPDPKDLSETALNDVQQRDAQENVRNFLNFQRLSRLKPVNDPATPPRELFPSPETDSPASAKTNLTENLRNLPKLRIPKTHTSSSLTPNHSAQRTITPSILQKKQTFTPQTSHGSPIPRESLYSPGDFYRADPHYGQSTPWSEMDIPVIDIPVGPVARDVSQSVPPNMRFGGHDDPIARPASTKAVNHRRKPSLQCVPPSRTLERLDESSLLSPIDTPEDLERTPRAPHCRNPFNGPEDAKDVTHSGWMKKRKTTRLLRHEWEDHHFTLKGTRLAMYADEEASQRNTKALEHIDVDDYAVACSSLPTHSKLTAAFKKTVLKRKDDVQGEAAFGFSLIPSPQGNVPDRKTLFLNGPKPHHFAVKTRDERIDWMRELMLAKALRRGRESGASVKVNGAFR